MLNIKHKQFQYLIYNKDNSNKKEILFVVLMLSLLCNGLFNIFLFFIYLEDKPFFIYLLSSFIFLVLTIYIIFQTTEYKVSRTEKMINKSKGLAENFETLGIDWYAIYSAYLKNQLSEELCQKYIAFDFDYQKICSEMKTLDKHISRNILYRLPENSEIKRLNNIEKEIIFNISKRFERDICKQKIQKLIDEINNINHIIKTNHDIISEYELMNFKSEINKNVGNINKVQTLKKELMQYLSNKIA